MSEPLFAKRDRTRDQILVAAQSLLLEHSATELGIRQIAARAGIVHASFYNYYPSVDALIEDLGALILTAHGLAVAEVRAGCDDVAILFARTTRQTLRIGLETPGVSRLIFESGLSVDRFLTGLRGPLRADLVQGQKQGVFRIEDIDVAVAIVAGAMMGLSLDLYRKRAKPNAIEKLTKSLLVMLGVPNAKTTKLASEPVAFAASPSLPITWSAIKTHSARQSHVA